MLLGMSDETKPTSQAEPTPQPAEPTAKTEPAPAPVHQDGSGEHANVYKLMTWVRGGTTTSRFDKHIAEQHADAEARRKQQDEDRKAVATQGAKMYSHNFMDMHDPKVVLEYDDSKLGVRGNQLCELVVDDITEEHILIFVCLDCISRGVPSDLAQRRVSNKHRAWHLDTRDKGKMGSYVDAWGNRQVYIKAGKIVDTDVLKCSEAFCTYAIKIENNFMRRV